MPQHEWLAQDPIKGGVENERHAQHPRKDGEKQLRAKKIRVQSQVRRCQIGSFQRHPVAWQIESNNDMLRVARDFRQRGFEISATQGAMQVARGQGGLAHSAIPIDCQQTDGRECSSSGKEILRKGVIRTNFKTQQDPLALKRIVLIPADPTFRRPDSGDKVLRQIAGSPARALNLHRFRRLKRCRMRRCQHHEAQHNYRKRFFDVVPEHGATLHVKYCDAVTRVRCRTCGFSSAK